MLATLRWGRTRLRSEADCRRTPSVRSAGQPLDYNKRDPRAFGVLVTAPAIHPAAVERLAERAKKLAG